MCLKVAGLLEELSTVGTSMWFDAIVAKDMCDQVVLRGVGFVTHAALPALEAIANIYTVGLINLNVDIESVHSASSMAPWGLGLLRLLMLCPSTPVCPDHGLAGIFILAAHSNLS